MSKAHPRALYDQQGKGKIGVVRFTAYRFRRRYATIAANGENTAPMVLQGTPGAANFATTMNIDAELDNERICRNSSGRRAAYARIPPKKEWRWCEKTLCCGNSRGLC